MAFSNFERSLILTAILAIITISQSQDTLPLSMQQHHMIPSQTDIENQEFALEEQFKKQAEEELNDWIVQQMRLNEVHPQIQPYESAIFYLKPNVTHVYRIPVSLAQTMMIEVSVFQVGNQGEILLPQNPSQQDYVHVSSQDENSHVQYAQGNVYLSRIFQLKFTQKKMFIKFRNNANHPLIVVLDLEQQQMLMQIIVSDDQFTLTNKKMQTLLKETKQTQINREHLYKWQWGFYEKHQRHQVDMLGFTGAQLLAIIGTSIVQMYCIKNLIDNQLII